MVPGGHEPSCHRLWLKKSYTEPIVWGWGARTRGVADNIPHTPASGLACDTCGESMTELRELW